MATIRQVDVDKLLAFVYNIYTKANYRSHLKHFVGVDASAEAIQAVVSGWHGLSQSTIRARRAALKGLLELMSAEGMCAPGILGRVKFPKGRPPKKRRALTVDEVYAVMDATETTEEKLLIAVMIDTGLRLGSIVNITYRDLRESSFDLQVKTGKEITVFVTSGMTVLGRAMQDSLGARDGDYIFTSGGEPVTYYHLYQVFNGLAKRAGIDSEIVPHSTRHTFATRLADAGESLPVIQGLMGHSDIQTTMMYVHPAKKAMRAAVENNELSRRLLE